MLTDTDRPSNRRAIGKCASFDLLPMYILHIIYMWIVRLENYENFKAIVTQINIPRNPVLRVDGNNVLERTIFFGNLSYYHRIKYEWVDRCYDKYVWNENTHLIKHKNELINKVPSRMTLHPFFSFCKLHNQYIDSRLLWRHTHWTLFIPITVIHYYYTCSS